MCVVDVFQEGHEGETAAVNVSTRPRKVHIEKVSLLFFKFVIRGAVAKTSGRCTSPARGHCVMFLCKTLVILQCLSPPRRINGYR